MHKGLALPQAHISESSFIEMKIDSVTEGLEAQFANKIRRVSIDNRLIVINFLSSMKLESNISHSHKRNYIRLLHKLSKFYHDKNFKVMTRDDVVSFLDSVRKLEVDDQLHKWIGTYNLYRGLLLHFFKWLYFPDIEPSERPKPQVIENIAGIKRKETSIYKPSDIWTTEDDLLFLQYCPNKRDRCYHAISRDTGCRPSELLKLKMKDIAFKSNGSRQYAQVFVNGKTGSRALLLINSIPYVKDWLDDHPQKGNPNAPLICGFGKSIGRRIQPTAINRIYANYKKMYFPKLLDSDIPIDDKRKINELLVKPWNPYIRRHSALTEKSTQLKEHMLRQYAGWSPRSNMHQRYLHYFGNESNESILEACGIVTKDQKMSNALNSKQCPHCNESNKPDSKFCVKCRMVLTYDAYNETLEEQKAKEDRITIIERQLQTLFSTLGNMTDQNKINELSDTLFDSGIIKPAMIEDKTLS
ncbi:MAG TPA: hypothetical protein VH796_09285 [Nitrososphaeraceae archaeon]